jgi:L-lactate dehydrogenase (cytochrome)
MRGTETTLTNSPLSASREAQMTVKSSKRMSSVLSLNDLEGAARRYLPRPLFAYVSGAAEDDRSVRQNSTAFGEYAFVPRVLVDVSARDQAVSLLGRTYAAPFGIAPMGLSAISAYRADIVMARAAAAARIPMILSGASLIRLEDVAKAAPGTWFQAYLPGDDDRIDALLNRVEAAGYETLVVTVDVPVAGNRENNIRSGFSTPLRPGLRLAWDGLSRPRWLLGTMTRTLLAHGMPHFENASAQRGSPILSSRVEENFNGRDDLTWRHLERIRRRWTGKLIIKGILRVADAVMASDIGADSIIVSNHGGRQLDGAVSPLRVLPGIVQAVPDIPVMIDGGFRRGAHVLTALSLGAKFVFVGRPFLYAAAIGGEAGVSHAIKLVSEEVDRNMALLGICSCGEMTADLARGL